MVDGVRKIEQWRYVFNCLSCGQLLSIDTNLQMGVECPNCGAAYDNCPTEYPIFRCGEGRPPTQWISNGYDPTKEAKG